MFVLKTCAELFADIPCTILGNPDEEISGLAYNSSKVQPGDMFFCIVGLSVDGHTFAQDAVDRGAKVLVAERKLYLVDATDVTIVVVADSRSAMAKAACNFYDDPSEAFSLVGITGTNGKTTTTYLVDHIARSAGYKTGVIGTVGLQIGDKRLKSDHTTPESPDLQETFAQMRDAGCQAVAMEVSSHALDLDRTLGTKFEVTAFSNLTQDHLDYHHTFDDYFEAKAKLFSDLYPAKRVVCIADKWGQELAERCRSAGDDLITVGPDSTADIYPTKTEYSAVGTRAEVMACGLPLTLEYPLVGQFNVENALVAFGIGLQMGMEAADIANALKTAHAVPGRLERVKVHEGGGAQSGEIAGAETAASEVVDTAAADRAATDRTAVTDRAATADRAACAADDQLPSVYVDYAHTPDALAKAMASVAGFTEGRLIVVFGCGGDRDAAKRPIMGKAALAADYAIVTSDNPRSEDPHAIIEDIVAGMGGAENTGKFEIEADRRCAIERAISMAQPGDSILVAGKGHEDYQIIGSETIHFDDREVAASALKARLKSE